MTEKIIPFPSREVNEILLRNILLVLISAKKFSEVGDYGEFEAD